MIKANTWNANGKLATAQEKPVKKASQKVTQKTTILPKESKKKRARHEEPEVSREISTSKTPEEKPVKKRGIFSRLSGN